MVPLLSSKMLCLVCVFYLLLCQSCVENKSLTKPDLRTHECLRRAHYNRDPLRFACKDFGLCYKYYCQQISRRCSNCKESSIIPVPCYAAENKAVTNVTREPRQKYVTMDADLFQTRTSEIPEDFPNKGILSLTAGGQECSAFVAAFPYKKGLKHVIVTAARCLVDFTVECTASNLYKNDTLRRQGHHVCFGYKRWQVQSVKKGFRSYCATISNKGLSTQIALNGKTVMVPRQYIECGDCRFDLAAIRLTLKQFEELNISFAGAHTLVAKNKAQLANQTASVQSMYENCDTADKKCNEPLTVGGVISSAQKMKLCIVLGNTTLRTVDNLLPGSPVSLSDGDASETVGVATHVVHTNMQMDGYSNEPITVTPSPFGTQTPIFQVSIVSAVRISKGFISFVGRWLDASRDRSPCAMKLHPRFDCFPSYPKAFANQSLCMCARGWTNERNSCKNSLEVMSEKCKWNAERRNAKCDDQERLPNKINSRRKRAIDLEIIPGSTTKLSLLYNNVTNGVEIEELLRHLTDLHTLVLDCNHLEKAMWKTFQYGRRLRFLSLRLNNLTWLHTGTFRKNRQLLYLCLANNSIPAINNKHFSKQNHLVNLDLSDNKISEVTEKAFRKLRKLERVLLGYNQLRTLPRYLFQKTTKLREIWLEHNLLEELRKEIFSFCPELRYVNLEGNRLVRLPNGLFMGNPLLHNLNFNHNQLASLPSDLLDHQSYIAHVSLYNNTQLPLALTLSEFTPSTINTLKGFLDRYGRG